MAGPGATKVTGTLVLNGISSLATGRVLENRGLIDLRGTATVFDDGSGRVENLGTIRKTAGTSSTIGAPLRNAGTVDGQVGELRLDDGTDQPDTGTFTGVVFVGPRTFTSAVAMPGTVEIADDLTVRDGDTLTIAGTAVQRAGTLRGNVAVNGRLTWDGGRHAGSGTTTVGAAGADRDHAAGGRSRAVRRRSPRDARSSTTACCGSRRAPISAPAQACASPTPAASSSTRPTTTRAARPRASRATPRCSTRAPWRRRAGRARRTCACWSTTTARSTGRWSSRATRRSRTPARSRT